MNSKRKIAYPTCIQKVFSNMVSWALEYYGAWTSARTVSLPCLTKTKCPINSLISACEVHTTFGIDFLRVWPLLQTNSSHDLLFHVRASHKATIQLTQTPAVPFPCLLVLKYSIFGRKICPGIIFSISNSR